METLKFLMITTHYPPLHMGGDAMMVKYLSDELVSAGHEVCVCSSPTVYRIIRGTVTESGCDPVSDGVILRPYRPSIGKMAPFSAHVLGAWGGARRHINGVIDEEKPDVVHWHNTRGFIGNPASTRSNVSLYTAHDYYSVCPRSNLLRPGGKLCAEARLCGICSIRHGKTPQVWRMGRARILDFPKETLVLCPSRFMAAKLSKGGVRIHRVLCNFVPRRSTESSVARSHRPTIVFTGLLERHKGPHTLLEAFSICRERQGFDMTLMGEGSLRDELKRRTNELGLADRVDIPGFVPTDEYERILSNASCVVVPSEWYENAPLVVLEALSRGIPVMGSRIGGIPEQLNPTSDWATFEPADRVNLSEAIVRLWESKDVLPRRGMEAKARYESLFTPERHLSEYLEIINSAKT